MTTEGFLTPADEGAVTSSPGGGRNHDVLLVVVATTLAPAAGTEVRA